MRLLSPQGVVKLVWGLILIATVSVLAKYCKDHSPNKDDAKLREVEAIYAQLPFYPDFQEVNHNFSSKDVSAFTEKYYASSANYSYVRSFYLERLSASGWQLTNERNMKDWWRDFGGRELRFGKAPYSVIIEYRGDKEPDPDWNYAVIVKWNKS